MELRRTSRSTRIDRPANRGAARRSGDPGTSPQGRFDI
jgi:hypothetical protein